MSIITELFLATLQATVCTRVDNCYVTRGTTGDATISTCAHLRGCKNSEKKTITWPVYSFV